MYSEQEYQLYLHDDAWTKAETDHLFDLSRRFDLRFVVIHDRYDHQQFKVSWCYAFACVPPRALPGPFLHATPSLCLWALTVRSHLVFILRSVLWRT